MQAAFLLLQLIIWLYQSIICDALSTIITSYKKISEIRINVVENAYEADVGNVTWEYDRGGMVLTRITLFFNKNKF